MGSEHSSQLNRDPSKKDRTKSSPGGIRRQHTIANPGEQALSLDPGDNGRSISPGPSVCSDIDLPYISYTVNRPIGDSPKLANKQLIKSKCTTTRRSQTSKPKASKNAHNIVVVRGGNENSHNTEKDPDVLRLQSIPMFLPIMRATLRDPEVLERLDPTPLRNLCLRYQHHLTVAANLVATDQNQLTQRVREVDSDITKMVTVVTDRQKKYAKYADKLSKVSELSHQLNRCHMLLNQILESMETLNNKLDIEDRLEPFVWTTG
ncbi:BLOC-1-related complex subunit 5 isoform X2 [Anthonomus grandis grandis]|uniref:BLOC-1-related complex subunit 5 isoform X2 n=1 Tax=Anthonomus grandis grandis TaxID=2921223 RepID=UPI0021652F9F|nr:BLOC-1-related complex subunit 5 isoform X2 [Anthonomus grandis grandis]